MKNKLNNLEILNNLSDLYFEVLMNDEEALKEFLMEEKFNLDDLDHETDQLIAKLKRDAKINTNKKNKSKLKLYVKAKEFLDALPSIDEYLQSLNKEEIERFELAYRNTKTENNKNIEELRKDLIILKVMEELEKKNE